MEINYTLDTSRITYDGKHHTLQYCLLRSRRFALAIFDCGKIFFSLFLYCKFDLSLGRWKTEVDRECKRENMTLKCVNCSINRYQVFRICIIRVWLSFFFLNFFFLQSRAGSCPISRIHIQLHKCTFKRVWCEKFFLFDFDINSENIWRT